MAKAYASAVIDTPVDIFWKVVRDFNALSNWHPVITKSEIENGLSSTKVGCIRSFYLTDGAQCASSFLLLMHLSTN